MILQIFLAVFSQKKQKNKPMTIQFGGEGHPRSLLCDLWICLSRTDARKSMMSMIQIKAGQAMTLIIIQVLEHDHYPSLRTCVIFLLDNLWRLMLLPFHQSMVSLVASGFHQFCL